MDLTGVPLLDHHCHALLLDQPLDRESFRRLFTESSDSDLIDQVPFTVCYSRAVRDLAELLGCDATEDAVLDARRAAPPREHAHRLFGTANLSAAGVDTGYLTNDCYRLEEQRAFLPCPLFEVLRIETEIESRAAEAGRFVALEEAFRASLAGVRARGIVALKSIAAYRGGLEIGSPSRDDAEAAYRAHRSKAGGALARLTERPLLEYFLRIALESAAALELPVQFHCGFGDADADLRSANPLHLRPLLQDPALRGARFVLLHNYPFIREAGYLASLYSNIYVDLSLTVPFAAHGGESAARMALELAPASRLLMATDAAAIPERFYVGALNARRSLARALERLHAEEWVTAAEADRAARQALHDNAASLYGMP